MVDILVEARLRGSIRATLAGLSELLVLFMDLYGDRNQPAIVELLKESEDSHNYSLEEFIQFLAELLMMYPSIDPSEVDKVVITRLYKDGGDHVGSSDQPSRNGE